MTIERKEKFLKQKMVEYNIKKNPEKELYYIGRTIGGDLWILFIRNNKNSLKKV
jgi:hypothetical protein